MVWMWNLVPHSEEHNLRVFENSVLRKMFGYHREEVTGDWSRLHNELMICAPNQLLHVWSNQELNGQKMWHVWGEERCIQGFDGETKEKETVWKTQA